MSQPRGLTAADIMSEQVVTSGPNNDLSEIAAKMQRHRIGSVVIVEGGRLVGILTERDFVRIFEAVGMLLEKNQAKHYMAKPVITVQSDTPIHDVIKVMREKHVRHLIVLNKTGKVVGIISSRDLMKVAKDVVLV
jgi:CBS domain-containing protein